MSALKRIINENGIFATQSESPESFKEIHIKIKKSITNIFKVSSTMYSFVPFYPSGIWSWTFASDKEENFLSPKNNEIENIHKSCEIWNLDYQEGGLKMMPNKLVKEFT